MDLGYANNNEAKLIAVKQGLIIARRENWQRLIIEGDSELVTGILRKLQQGTPWEKITQIWRIAALILEVSQLMRHIQYLLPSHIQIKGNAAADYLANWGCQHPERPLDGRPMDAIWDVELHSLQLIVGKDLQPLDWGELFWQSGLRNDCWWLLVLCTLKLHYGALES